MLLDGFEELTRPKTLVDYLESRRHVERFRVLAGQGCTANEEPITKVDVNRRSRMIYLSGASFQLFSSDANHAYEQMDRT